MCFFQVASVSICQIKNYHTIIRVHVFIFLLDWCKTKATRSTVVTRNYMQTKMPGKYVKYYVQFNSCVDRKLNNKMSNGDCTFELARHASSGTDY